VGDEKVLDGAPERIQARLLRLETELRKLLASEAMPFDARIASRLPKQAGIYRIFDPRKPSETARAGRTNSAAGGLRQRVYGNHLMGNQSGNLRAQLKRAGVPGCADSKSAKEYIRQHLAVQVLVVGDKAERDRLEHFMLAVLEPTYCD
jgi:hypothetical protein